MLLRVRLESSRELNRDNLAKRKRAILLSASPEIVAGSRKIACLNVALSRDKQLVQVLARYKCSAGKFPLVIKNPKTLLGVVVGSFSLDDAIDRME